MDYKYKKNQLFGKRLKVPKNILDKVYSSSLTFEEYIEHKLEDKIPISCIRQKDRMLVEKFGLKKCKNLDWELINNKNFDEETKQYIREKLLSIDKSSNDITAELYNSIINYIVPDHYSPKMKEKYKDRCFEITPGEHYGYLKRNFNYGYVNLKEIIEHWFLFKDMNFDYQLGTDHENAQTQVDTKQVRNFMTEFSSLSRLIMDSSNIYEFIRRFSADNIPKEEKDEYIREFCEEILNKSLKSQNNIYPIELTDEQYRAIFKYASIEEYLTRINEYKTAAIFEELKALPEDYIFNTPFPIIALANNNVLNFIGEFGLKNIVDFDNECGHFFSKNNCEMLKLMFEMYMHYGGNEHDPQRNIFATSTSERYNESGKYLGRIYTKDEFYESMRRMIIYGPSNWEYASKAPDYRNMTGEFRVRNSELFISEEAPEELQKLFYTKSITTKLLVEHPEYIQYLNGKDLGSCFIEKKVKIKGSKLLYGYENFYNFLSSKTDFNGVMSFITEYSDVFDIVFDRAISDSYKYEIEFSMEDNINEIKKRINDILKRIIIEKGLAYPKNIPKDLIENYPSMFLSPDAPEELKEAFYTRTINSNLIQSNTIYKDYLKQIDLEIIYKYMLVRVGNGYYNSINLVRAVKQAFSSEEAFDVMLTYGKYIESVFEINELRKLDLNSDFSKNDLLEGMDAAILDAIISNGMLYDENMPKHFQNSNPTLFLGQNVPKDIRDRFYNREFTVDDFGSNPTLLELFENTNIACGFSENVSWIIPLFSNNEDIKNANHNRLKVISEYLNIQDVELQKLFKEFIKENQTDLNIERISVVADILVKIAKSNSSEMYAFKTEIAKSLLYVENPLSDLDKIENIFIKNNIPTVGKIYSVFNILHPDFKGPYGHYANIEDFSLASPVLKNSSTRTRSVIVFSDLIKASFGSNNRSVRDYIDDLEQGQNIYERCINENVNFDSLSPKEKETINLFCKHLMTLYENTKQGKVDENNKFKDDPISTISQIKVLVSPNDTIEYNLADRMISMFCHFAGIDTLEEAKMYCIGKIQQAESRNIEASKQNMELVEGDFIKGIRRLEYLSKILQNGSVAREFLGASADSDYTPLDTDLSRIKSSEGTINDKFSNSIANSCGPIWFVLKNNGKFHWTRAEVEDEYKTNNPSKIEIFRTGEIGSGHYGIRTGFASSDIDYIVIDEPYDKRVGLEIALNGFYIPVANKEGKIVFTPDDYDKLREKMSGLSHYGIKEYSFSKNLVTDETTLIASEISESEKQTAYKREKINQAVQKSLDEISEVFGKPMKLKTSIDGDLSDGYIELIDTGSTGRGTNKPGDGDFDFMMRLDKSIIDDSEKLAVLKQVLLKNLGKEESANGEIIATGDFRLKGVELEDVKVDVDITFTQKTDQIQYSTDAALEDRLSTIKEQEPEKYSYVVANILLAKKVLKEAGCYKPDRGETPQGGLGGVGIENWILQHGGSFEDAANSFLEASEGKTFAEFKESYVVWDFGENHLSVRKGNYAHDNFVYHNMSETGYTKMKEALATYFKQRELSAMQENSSQVSTNATVTKSN